MIAEPARPAWIVGVQAAFVERPFPCQPRTQPALRADLHLLALAGLPGPQEPQFGLAHLQQPLAILALPRPAGRHYLRVVGQIQAGLGPRQPYRHTCAQRGEVLQDTGLQRFQQVLPEQRLGFPAAGIRRPLVKAAHHEHRAVVVFVDPIADRLIHFQPLAQLGDGLLPIFGQGGQGNRLQRPACQARPVPANPQQPEPNPAQAGDIEQALCVLQMAKVPAQHALGHRRLEQAGGGIAVMPEGDIVGGPAGLAQGLAENRFEILQQVAAGPGDILPGALG